MLNTILCRPTDLALGRWHFWLSANHSMALCVGKGCLSLAESTGGRKVANGSSMYVYKVFPAPYMAESQKHRRNANAQR